MRLLNQVLQVEEVHVAREVAEQSEEVCVPGERFAQWAGLAEVMPADALQRQIETVPDPWMASTRAVDRHLAVDLVARPDHHPADRVTDALERLGFRFRDLTDDLLQLPSAREARNHPIARQAEP